MKKLLIIGCSHSVGSWITFRKYNTDSGWVYNIAKKYKEYHVDCISHLAGGVFNYIITIGLLDEEILKYDKVIVQHSVDEPRITFYNIDYENIFNVAEYSTSLNNLKRFDYTHKLMNYKNENLDLYGKFSVQINRNEALNYIYDMKNGLYINYHLMKAYKNIINNIFKNKLYSFEWNDIINKIDNMYGKDTYLKMINTVDNYHIDEYGNKLVFELIEPDLDNFL